MGKIYEVKYEKLPDGINYITVKFLETGKTIIYVNEELKEKGEMK